MEILGERPAWSMTDSEKLSRLDAAVAEIHRLKTYYLHLAGDLDASGYANDIGAGDTARFLSTRYRIDADEARRDLRLAKSLTKYQAIAAALPDPATPFPGPPTPDAPANPHQTADPDHTEDTDRADDGGMAEDTDQDVDADQAEGAGTVDEADSNKQTDRGRPMHPAQAAAIVSALDKVPDTVPVENLDAAERQLINLARTFTPSQLRNAAHRMRNILDPDGPEPDENRAYHRESLTLKPADNGVKFGGYLANENAELLRTLIHSGAKPHKTIDGHPDPRPRDKRQADALTTLLNTAATITHTTSTTSTASNRTTTTTASSRTTTTTAGDRSTTNTSPADRHTTGNAGSDPSPASHPDGPTRPSTSTGANARTDAPPGHRDSTSTAGNSDQRGRGDLPPVDSPAAHEAPSHEAPSHEAPSHEASSHEASTHDGSSRDASGHDTFGQYIPGHGPKAHLTITIDYHALKAATADATGQTVFGDDLSAAAVRRLACDAQAIPVVLGTKSQPLDVGTTKRLITAPMRLALNARDRGCVVCGAPPIQCEAHHLVHWIDGGNTSVSNLVLLCKRHHIDLHTGHWHIQIINDVVHVTRPGWATPDPIPPNTYKPPIHHDTADTSTCVADPARPHNNDRGQHHSRSQASTPDLRLNATPDEVRQAIWGDDIRPATPGSSQPAKPATTRPSPFVAARPPS
ncbi:HNH endonuclease [Kribbella steppae]|uniref:HNH endonuclease n=1 Tax=Kribbella steppae TaxID=2512223 RepID=A0A4R2H7S9_9ACTN|nr:HNH endonuclease signature motif containing protein [Kribbella steppae]TCO22268.1 HNH endonuclease [Kribbella steppae]